jgi:hypothetical protein
MRRFRNELASVLAALALILVLVLASGRTAPADDAGSTQKPKATHTAAAGTLQPSSADSTPATTPADQPDKTKKAKRRGGDHLPLYYKDVVTDDQKKQIYSIQDEYKPKLNALKEQLKALTAERDAKLDALLTADQKTKVEAKRAEAQAKRAEAKAIAKRAEAKAQRAEKKESRGKSAKHVATPSTETPVEKPADQAPPK